MIKKFLNWFLGSTEKKSYNPYDDDWNSDGTEEKIKELKLDGAKMDLKFNEIPDILEFKAAINKANCFLNLKKIFNDKVVIKKWKNYKFASVNATIDDVCNDLPIIFFAYKFDKEKINIGIIEAVYSYSQSLQMKDFISKLKAFLKKMAKQDKFESKEYSVRIVKLSPKAGWSFEKLLEYMVNDKNFVRDSDAEDNKDLERIYKSPLK